MRLVRRSMLLAAAVSILLASVTDAAGPPDRGTGFTHRHPAAALGNCNTGQVRLWENNSHGGNSLIRCFGDSEPNLGMISAPLGCDGGVLIYEDWHDCISSFQVTNADCHVKLQVYEDESYGSAMPSPYSGVGNRSNTSMGSYNDTMTSLKWTYLATCPT